MNILKIIFAWIYGLPTDIYLTRHGESRRNVGLKITKTGLFFDTLEQMEKWGLEPDHKVPLTDDGFGQARGAGKKLAQRFNKIGMPHVCIHSGYKRAHSTAQCIQDEICDMTGKSLPLVENFSLREREAGITHVMLSSEVENLLNWNDRYWKCKGGLFGRPIAGESLLQLRETRVRNFLWDYLKQFSARTIVVVCHGRVMQALHMEMSDMSILEMEAYLKEPHPENCEIRHYEFNWRTRKFELVETM